MIHILTIEGQTQQAYTDKDAAKLRGIISGKTFTIQDIELNSNALYINYVTDNLEEFMICDDDGTVALAHIKYKQVVKDIMDGPECIGQFEYHEIESVYVLDDLGRIVSVHKLGLSPELHNDINEQIQQNLELKNEETDNRD